MSHTREQTWSSIAIIAMVDDEHVKHPVSTGDEPSHISNSNAGLRQVGEPLAVEDSVPRLDNLSKTLIIVNKTSLISSGASNQTSISGDELHREPLSTFFPASKGSVKKPLISQKKFHWDQVEQGHILGAFFYGYILFQIPGARMAELVGAKWIVMAANAGSALISLLFPLSTQLNSIYLLMVLRFVMGLCQSAFFPGAYVLFCRWFPEKERAVLLPIMFIGSNMGSVSAYIMSSYLVSSSGGWPSVFYVSGFVCALVTIFWCVFGSNGPDDNWLITEEERRYIERNVNNQSSENLNETDGLTTSMANNNHSKNKLTVIFEDPTANGRKLSGVRCELTLKKSASCCGKLSTSEFDAGDKPSVDINNNNNNARPKHYEELMGTNRRKDAPKAVANKEQTSRMLIDEAHSKKKNVAELSWPKLLKSVPVWILILSMYGNEWSNVVICYELPTYLNKALSFPIEQNGVINSFFQLSYTLASPVMSALGAYMLDKHVLGMRKIHVRKLFQSLATFGQLACFVIVPICGANRGLIIMFMFSAYVFKTCANAGDIMVPGDLSPEYAGTIFAFANSIGNTAGFFVPLLAAAIVDDRAYEREQWTPFWLATGAIMGASGLIFLFLGQTRRQDFSKDESNEEHNHELEAVKPV